VAENGNVVKSRKEEMIAKNIVLIFLGLFYPV